MRKYKKDNNKLTVILPKVKENCLTSIDYNIILYFSINLHSPFNLNNLIVFRKKINSEMMLSNPESPALLFHKIRFSLRKRVNFGQGVYVCGNIQELGQWDPSKAYRLKWNEGDIWSGSLLVDGNAPETIEYKYIISDWRNPSLQNTDWEIGTYNRHLDLGTPKSITICDDRWNMDKITLNLFVSNGKNSPDSNYYVVGDILELGNWEQKKQMKKINKKGLTLSQKQNLNSIGHQSSEQELYSFSFYTYRNKEQIFYYYIKKNTKIESERKPGRVFKFNDQHSAQQHRIKVAHSRGETVIMDEFSVNQLVFSQITPQIFVGSYPKSKADIQKLKQHKISAIFSIQSQKDFNRHGLSPHYLKLICQENGITYRKYSILDMNNQDFVSKAAGGLKMMRDLMRQGEKVYVHCTAGIYRSPQMIALYLAQFEDYSIEQAINKVKDSHPFAKPSCKVVKEVVSLIRLHRSFAQILI